jgi:hypothetical protein
MHYGMNWGGVDLSGSATVTEGLQYQYNSINVCTIDMLQDVLFLTCNAKIYRLGGGGGEL